MKLILASASPRRKAILESLQIPFEVAPTSAEEILDPKDPVRSVFENAKAKAFACRSRFPDDPILAADTLVWFDGHVLGKPRDMQEAASFLRSYSGKTQFVYTGIAFLLPGKDVDVRVEASSVLFKNLSEEQIQHYLQETRPLDRAGAYDINTNGDEIIASYQGSYTNIMGLPSRQVRDWWASITKSES